MNLIKSLIISICFISCSNLYANFSILHYNIKELTTKKINSHDKQLKYAKSVINQFNFDIASINEVQYDLPNIPNSNFKTKGQNLEKIQQILKINNWNYSFNPANTGMNARPKDNGTYYSSPSEEGAFQNADHLNFGVFPAQYSTGAIFKYPKISETVINKLKWKTFNPNINLSKFKDGKGNTIPNTIELFDKNFSDVLIKVEGKILHLVLLHTVPSFHFGNKDTMNYERNRDQLRFLEWYLTGSTDINIPPLEDIKPLNKNDYFITVGDFNINIKGNDHGSLILQSLFSKIGIWDEEATYTNESSGFSPSPMKLMLDYIGFSHNLKLINAKTYTPPSKREEAGCENYPPEIKNKNIVSYNKNNNICYAYVENAYYKAKMASDHFPIWAEFKFDK